MYLATLMDVLRLSKLLKLRPNSEGFRPLCAFLVGSRTSTLRRMLASAFVWLLAWLPVVQARATQPPSDPGRAASSHSGKAPSYPIGTSVEVQLRNKEKISGRLEKYANDGFWIKAEGRGPEKNRKIFYFEMQSMKARNVGQAGAKGEAPRFSMDLSIGGTGAAVRVYQPQGRDSKEPEDSGPPR